MIWILSSPNEQILRVLVIKLWLPPRSLPRYPSLTRWWKWHETWYSSEDGGRRNRRERKGVASRAREASSSIVGLLINLWERKFLTSISPPSTAIKDNMTWSRFCARQRFLGSSCRCCAARRVNDAVAFHRLVAIRSRLRVAAHVTQAYYMRHCRRLVATEERGEGIMLR